MQNRGEPDLGSMIIRNAFVVAAYQGYSQTYYNDFQDAEPECIGTINNQINIAYRCMRVLHYNLFWTRNSFVEILNRHGLINEFDIAQ